MTFTAPFRLNRSTAPTLLVEKKTNLVLKLKSSFRRSSNSKQKGKQAAVRDLSAGRWGGRKLGGVQKEEGS